MPRGRPRKPYTLRVLEGGRGKSRSLTPDLPAPVGRLLPPKTLTKEEREAWKQQVNELRKMNVESPADAGLFEVMIAAYCRFRGAKAHVQKHGMTMISAKGNRVKRPEVSIMREFGQLYAQIAAQFGIGPAARAKLGGSGRPRGRAGDVPPELKDAKRG